MSASALLRATEVASVDFAYYSYATVEQPDSVNAMRASERYFMIFLFVNINTYVLPPIYVVCCVQHCNQL